MQKKIIIIGSGIGGIATSIRLALQGYAVQVFESDKLPGGKLNLIEMGSYRFDFGPSLFTMPWLVTELFELAGKNPSDYFRYKQTEPACTYFWEDGTVLQAFTDQEKFAEELKRLLDFDKKKLIDYLAHTQKLFDVNVPVFLEKSLHKPGNYFSRSALKAAFYLPKSDILKTMNRANEKRLGHPKLVQLFNRMATYNGSNPYKASGILTQIASLEHGTGVFFPEGGMYNITTSLVKLAEELGVTFNYSEAVERILHKNKKVIGVKTIKDSYEADGVVSNMDITPTWTKLLPDVKAPKKIISQERSSSALVFYWGMKNTYNELGLHNIFFSKNYKEEFKVLFEDLDVYDDPTIYVHISSKLNRNDAPDGHESWFVMVNAPHREKQDWNKLVLRSRKTVVKKLSSILGRNISDDIDVEYSIDPRIIESKTSSYKGSLYGSSSNSMISAFLRHPNFTGRLKNLWFVGGSAHPGGGIPLCLMGAKIVADILEIKE